MHQTPASASDRNGGNTSSKDTVYSMPVGHLTSLHSAFFVRSFGRDEQATTQVMTAKTQFIVQLCASVRTT